MLYQVGKKEKKPIKDASKMMDACKLLYGCPKIMVNVKKTRNSDYILSKDVDRIAEHRLDVLFRVNGFRIIRGEVLKRGAACGVWSYHHADNRVNRGTPPAFYEFIENKPCTGAVLQILNEDLDNGLVISRVNTATNRLYGNMNLNGLLWRGMNLLPRALALLHLCGVERFMEHVNKSQPSLSFYCHSLRTWPTDRDFLRNLPSLIARHVRQRIQDRFYIDSWEILYRFDRTLSSAFWRYKVLVPPKNVFWADPFPFYHNGCHYVFMEEYEYAKGKGRVVVTSSPDGRRLAQPQVVMDLPFHISYPSVFEHSGRIFMLPETLQNRSVTLYEAHDFPRDWRPIATLLDDCKASDPTLFHHEGRWWLFVSMAEPSWTSINDELFLFSSESLTAGEWKPHPMNPVVSDVRGARCAGNILRHEGKIYRFAQDCSSRYGAGIVAKEIIRLNEFAYEEAEVTEITPAWNRNYRGIHTINYIPGLSVADALRLRWKRRI